MSRRVTWSKTVTFFENDWHEGNVAIMGPRTHAIWLGSSVFDGARAFDGVTPDLDRHCERQRFSQAVASSRWSRWRPGWAWPARAASASGATPSFISGRCTGREDAAAAPCVPTPSPPAGASRSTTPPMPGRHARSRCRRSAARRSRPRRSSAKAGCLYPNNARALVEAAARLRQLPPRDLLGNVAELGTANIFMAKDGVVYTPANGTFLNGITRAGDRAAARRRRDRRRDARCATPSSRRRRDLLLRQLRQALADHRASTAAICSPARSTARRPSSTAAFAHATA